MEKFEKLLEKKAKSQKPMSNVEKDAKLRAIHEMRKMATDEMALPLKGIKKVTVASDSPEGVKKGLEKAKEMLGHEAGPEAHALDEAMPGHEESEELETSAEHEAEGVEGEAAEEEMSPEEIQAKIDELQALLKAKKA